MFLKNNRFNNFYKKKIKLFVKKIKKDFTIFNFFNIKKFFVYIDKYGKRVYNKKKFSKIKKKMFFFIKKKIFL